MMDHDKNKQQLIDELNDLRRRVAELEANDQNERESGHLQAILSAAIECLPFEFFAVGPDGRYIFQNAVSRQNFGDVIGKQPSDCAPDEHSRELWLDNNRRAFAGERVEGEVEAQVGGKTRTYYNVISPFQKAGEVCGILGVNVDITERKQAEEALRQSEHRQRAILDTIPDPAWLKDREGRFVAVNAAWCRFFGMDAENVLGKTVFEFFPADIGERLWEEDHGILQSRQQLQHEELLSDKDGRSVWFDTIRSPLFNDQGEAIGTTGLARDITARKKAEKALRESEARFRGYFELGLIGMATTSPEKGILQVNDYFCDMVGYSREELALLSWAEITYPDDLAADVAQFNRLVAREIEGYALEKRFRHKNGSLVYAYISVRGIRDALGQVDHIVAFAQDITDRKRAEEEKLAMERRLLHAQKLESIGVLAGGIAHDFNNILAGIMGYADLALKRLPASEPVRSDIEVIKKAVKRAADLTRQMLAYSGKGKFIVEPVDMSQVVEDSKKMLAMAVSKKARVTYNLTDNLPVIQADAAQMCQVVMNLVINASEALGERGGVIAVSTNLIRCEARELAGMELGQDLPEREYVCLEVADTGCGMDDLTLAKMFDPFFTTKFTGRGLGLSGVHGIVRGHKGAIQVSSEPGKGTTFRVLFPASGLANPAVLSESAVTSERGSGTVLVVDDEEVVRTLAGRMIEHAGFSALTASGGREAIRLLREHQNDVNCVLLDLTMPDMDGAETFGELRRIRPDVRVILSSGYSEEAATERFTGLGLAGFIQKPYQLDTLTARIQEALVRAE